MSKKDDESLLKIIQDHMQKYPRDADEPKVLAALCVGVAKDQGQNDLANVFGLIAGIPI